MNPYEEERILHEYLLFHYGSVDEIADNPFVDKQYADFPKRCITELLTREEQADIDNALDIGCAVGRSAFEISSFAKSVTAIDFSHSFINAANQLKSSRQLPYKVYDEGNRFRELTAKIPQNAKPQNIDFKQGDAQKLQVPTEKYNLVLAANLLCRLPEPKQFLQNLKNLIASNGILLLVSPYTWLESYTPSKNWIGGSHSEQSKDAIIDTLTSDFQLLREKDLPFLIREHKRKYQLGISNALVFKRSDS